MGDMQPLWGLCTLMGALWGRLPLKLLMGSCLFFADVHMGALWGPYRGYAALMGVMHPYGGLIG